jgi:pimeloyl-ACP methyl ester carboxylesterase
LVIPLHLAESGSGPPVFLIHAFPLDHGMWESQVEALAPRYRTLAPDLPGFGATPVTPRWRLTDIATAVFEIADQRQILRFALVGLSMGAYAAFEVLRQSPERIAALVLANGRARADTPPEREARTALITRVEAEGTAILEETMLPRLLRPDPDPDVEEQTRRLMARTRKEAVTQGLEALRERRDSKNLLATIRCPTLVLAGLHDPITPPDEMEAMALSIPGATFRKIPKAGHLSNLENPTAFNQALEAFLDEHFA